NLPIFLVPCTFNFQFRHFHILQQFFKTAPCQGLCQDVCNLVFCGNVIHVDSSILDKLPYEVISNSNVFCPWVMIWFVCKIYCSLVVTPNESSLCHVHHPQFSKKFL